MPASDSRTTWHIGRISRGFPPWRDGFSHHAALLSRYQVRLGHRVSAFVPQMTAPPGDFAVERIAAGRRELDPRRRRDLWLFAYLAARRVARAHASDSFDVLHCHGDATDASFASAAARRLRVPFVLTLHAGLSGRLAYRRLAATVFRRVNRFIVVAEHVRGDLGRLGIDTDNVSVISSGIEFERFAAADALDRRAIRRDLGVPDDTPVVLAAGRLHPLKGFEYLAEAAHRLPHVLFLIAGEGERRPAIEAAGRQAPNLRLLGTRAPDEMPALLRAADVFALPSVDLPGQSEGTPTAVLEAMAAGLPIVVTDSGGGGPLVRESDGGLVVAQRDAGALAEAIATLAADAGRRTAMGQRGRALARTRDWACIARRVLDVYASAFGDANRQR